MGALQLFMFLVLHSFPSVVLSISIENNAYKGIYISSSGEWSDQDLQKLKEVLTKSSENLYHATRKRAYFGEFILSGASCHTPPSQVPRRVDVYAEGASARATPTLRTQHSRGCGETGEVMYMPLTWLQGDTTELARQFVQQWSIYRYGVFEEDPIHTGSCYRSKGAWYAVGCYDRAKVSNTSNPEMKDGLPFCPIESIDTSSFVDSKSSLMFTSNISKALDFCDETSAFPHDPAMPTLHNSLCDGKTTWSVIQNSQDFKFGKNKPLMQPEPPQTPAFTGYCQNDIQLTFAIQNNTRGTDRTEAVSEIGYSLYHYLLNLKERSSSIKIEVNAVTFSDEEDNSAPLQLHLADEKLKNVIVDYVKTFRDVSGNCVSCGFRKSAEASNAKSPSTVVVIAWEDTLQDEPFSKILQAIRESPGSRFNLLLVENTNADVLSAELIEAIRSTGGQIFFLPKEPISMASSIHSVLSAIVKRPLQVEDDETVVHGAIFENIVGPITDSFTTLNPESGTLEYIIHCHPLNRIVPTMQDCVHTISNIDTYRCVATLEQNEIKLWEFNHTDKGGTKAPSCSSVAILHTLSKSKEKLTLKGWLSNHAIEPGKEPLLIFAEIIGSSDDYQVTAEVSGSDGFLVSIELRDNGNGDPDVKRGDGIFSRYFMPPSIKKGSYGVKILAESKVEVVNKWYANEPPKNVTIRRQSKSIGFFSVTKSFPEDDIFPPSRVGDLRAVSYDQENSTVTLQWTAPGNDYDNGTATSYEIKYSTNPSSLSEIYFNREENMEPIYKSEFTPSKSGTLEKIEISIPSIYDSSCYIVLRAKDGNNNKGKISNIIQVHINAVKSTSTQTSTDTTELVTTVPTSTESETSVSPELPTGETTTETVGDETFFDKKFIFIASTAAGILLFIVIINIIVCCCCVKKRKASNNEKTSRKSNSLSPYSLNIAYQNDSPEENDRDISVTTMGNPSIISEPRAKYSPRQQYTYHTPKSLGNLSKENNVDQLGFQLVETLPTTRSLSRFRNRLTDSNSETDSDGTTPVAVPQQVPKDARIYSLGIV